MAYHKPSNSKSHQVDCSVCGKPNSSMLSCQRWDRTNEGCLPRYCSDRCKDEDAKLHTIPLCQSLSRAPGNTRPGPEYRRAVEFRVEGGKNPIRFFWVRVGRVNEKGIRDGKLQRGSKYCHVPDLSDHFPSEINRSKQASLVKYENRRQNKSLIQTGPLVLFFRESFLHDESSQNMAVKELTLQRGSTGFIWSGADTFCDWRGPLIAMMRRTGSLDDQHPDYNDMDMDSLRHVVDYLQHEYMRSTDMYRPGNIPISPRNTRHQSSKPKHTTTKPSVPGSFPNGSNAALPDLSNLPGVRINSDELVRRHDRKRLVPYVKSGPGTRDYYKEYQWIAKAADSMGKISARKIIYPVPELPKRLGFPLIITSYPHELELGLHKFSLDPRNPETLQKYWNTDLSLLYMDTSETPTTSPAKDDYYPPIGTVTVHRADGVPLFSETLAALIEYCSALAWVFQDTEKIHCPTAKSRKKEELMNAVRPGALEGFMVGVAFSKRNTEQRPLLRVLDDGARFLGLNNAIY